MISEANTCFQDNPQGSFQLLYQGMEDLLPSPPAAAAAAAAPGSDTHSQSLLYNLSVLGDKVKQMQSLVTAVVSHQEPVALAVADASVLIQDIIISASSLMYAFQNVILPLDVLPNPTNQQYIHEPNVENSAKSILSTEYSYYSTDVEKHKPESPQESPPLPPASNIIDVDAADLLAKYTHHCQVCGKGFKRDANLRMHMRAHGDEYKTTAALTNPTKSSGSSTGGAEGECDRKYSCPQEGCRWNRKHAKFQPLKSMICVKNHYKRSHCPKMFVCNRCNRKQFSVLSDLRTHEKHCGDLKWRCSCGTTFSRKDKLMGHVALFVGHAPAMNYGSFMR